MQLIPSLRLGAAGLSLTTMLGGCAVNSVDEYNFCALGYGALGLGIGVASSGTGAVLAGAAGGGMAGYLICKDESLPPGNDSPKQTVAPMVAEPPVPLAPPAPIDTDGDGVTDNRDRCASTPSGVEVDAEGCPKPLVFDSLSLNFAFDSAELASNVDETLAAALAFISNYPEARFEIIGHTDAKGSDAYNMALSQRRAEALKERLVALGVSSASLDVSGYGESKPVATNDTEAGRARNRRVELHLIP